MCIVYFSAGKTLKMAIFFKISVLEKKQYFKTQDNGNFISKQKVFNSSAEEIQNKSVSNKTHHPSPKVHNILLSFMLVHFLGSIVTQ